MKAAGAVIIGGGVIGCSIAYHLSLNGIKDIIVLDKGSEPGTGSTGKATGGYRAQFGSKINIQLSISSRKKLLSFKEETGVDPRYEQRGYLFIAQTDEELSRLKQANILQHECGLKEVSVLNEDEVRKLNVNINHSNIKGGTFCPTDGFIKPINILQGYYQSSKKLGVKFFFGEDVTGFEIKNNRVNSISTKNYNIKSEVFINAGGAWASEIARMAGSNIPVTPLKRQVCRLLPKNTLPDEMPMTIWVKDSFHFRVRDEHIILLMPVEPENKNPFDTTVEKNWLNSVFNIGKERIPALQNCTIDESSSWAGLYEISPDEHIILGAAETPENFYFANGSSGHGVMHSPAIGELMAELITGKNTSIDISSLSPGRFAKGNLIQSIQFF